MEAAYPDDAIHDITADIYSIWLHGFESDATTEYKIAGLSKQFRVPFATVINAVFSDLSDHHLNSLENNQLEGIQRTLSLHPESSANQLQLDIIKAILHERKQ